jgi:hypothetical protein
VKLSTQLAAVICVGIIGLVTMVYFLVQAGWKEGSITGLAVGLGTIITGLIVAIGQQRKTADQVDQLQRQVGAGQRDQARKIDAVVEQTNGAGHDQLQDVADRAAAAAVSRYVSRETSGGR